ncbi:MAG: methyltransferase domain-containing protein [Solirubrobacterales bacterium]|nr:methyltransferase domain-containing protein [Solirubrobacterales bacterium]
MCARPYDTLAHVYEWLIPDDLLTAAGSAAVFAPLLEPLGRPARILDCAAGGGQLAVGLAAMGFDVVASDASAGMIARTQALAAEHNVALSARVCSWDELPAQGLGRFDAIFCVGNSLVHAPRQAGRQSALAAMASVLRHQGLLVLTSRNWEQVRNQGSGIEVADRMIERHARPGLVIHAWTVPDRWEQPHYLDVAVALLDDPPTVTAKSERFTLWPFTPHTLEQDLRSAGLTQASSTYTPAADRYLVTAHKSATTRATAATQAHDHRRRS